MNFRNRKLVITIRTLAGLAFLGSGAGGFYSAFHSMAGVPPEMMASTQSLWDMGIFGMIKTTEIVSGLMLIFGFLPQLATIFLSPICVGIFVFDFAIGHTEYLPSGIVVSILVAFLGYAYFDKYRALFQS
ncbi:MAG: hypothetical protein V4438_02330 [Patescibacteria group bacterium]